MRSNMEQRLLHVTITRNNRLSNFIDSILKVGGGAVNFRVEHIVLKKSDMYWLTQIEHPLQGV